MPKSREASMRRAVQIFTLALGAIILAAHGGAQAQEGGPIKIEKCQTINKPGSYRLVNNLTFFTSGHSAGTCLPITADFVTIDLAGFTISRQPVGFGGTAIAAGDNLSGITVRNGSISGFFIGVDLRGQASIVEGLRVIGARPSSLGIGANGIVK